MAHKSNSPWQWDRCLIELFSLILITAGVLAVIYLFCYLFVGKAT